MVLSLEFSTLSNGCICTVQILKTKEKYSHKFEVTLYSQFLNMPEKKNSRIQEDNAQSLKLK